MMFDEIYSPIKDMNAKLLQASEIAREQPGLVLAGQMLNQLRVSAIGHNFLVLRPTKRYLYRSMLKCQEEILQAIQLVVPEVEYISIIDVE